MGVCTGGVCPGGVCARGQLSGQADVRGVCLGADVRPPQNNPSVAT